MTTIKKRIGLLSLIVLLLASMLLLAACDQKRDRDEDDGTTTPTNDTTTTPDDDASSTPDADTSSTPEADTSSTPDADTSSPPDADTSSTPDADTSSTPDEPDVPTTPTYTVKVVDQNGNPVEGVKIQLCDNITGTCNPQRTKSDANGLVVITTLPEGDYYASALTAPTGYTVDPNSKGYFNEDNCTEIVVIAAE
ncbi:MAG: hypothetical protein IJW49_00315 [Clostridia bacterium]|nr:hypothetical protein [Clostridia bacterium]